MRTYSPNIGARWRFGVGVVVAITGVALLEVGAPPALAHTVAKVVGPSPSGSTYIVKAGDTLSGIAMKNKVTVSQLVAANGLKDQHFIVAGKPLTIPSRVPVAAGSLTKSASAPVSQAASPGQAPPASLKARPTYSALNAHFDRAAAQYGVPAEVLKAMAWQESGWNNTMVSSTGALGIGQLMPDTVAFANEVLIPGKALDPKDSAQNIQMSAAFYRYLLRENGGDHNRALASYYQGLASVRRIGLLPETEQYVRSVMAVRANWF